MYVSMIRSVTHYVCAACMLALSAGMLASCKKVEAPAPPEVRPAKLFTIGGDAVGRTLNFPGTVRAFDEAELSFLVAGKVIELPVKEGQQLEKGAVVGRLDDREFKSAVAAAQAQYKLAQTQFDSQKALYDKGVISKNDFDKATRDIDVAKSNLETAQKNLEDTVLVAPYAGHAARRYIETRQNVQPKQAVLLLQDIMRLKITVNIPEQDLARGKGAQLEKAVEKARATATLPALPGRTFDLKLHEVSLTADPDTRTYAATFTMHAPTNALVMPGMTANVTLPFSPDGSVPLESIAVPATAVFSAPSGTSCVWLVNMTDMTVHQQPVVLGDMAGSGVSILGGLAQGDTIVAAGTDRLSEGQKVSKYGK
ncbi:efflux RND transporter periplasmic adaptor subunit [bacterium]|nr:efflux RND transporter periplasmic adaptor subunit [bacterium]